MITRKSACGANCSTLLRVLVENAGKLVRKDAFMESVWPDSVVEDNNLDYCISQLRKLLHPAKYIETVPRHGYRFVAEVTIAKPHGPIDPIRASRTSIRGSAPADRILHHERRRADRIQHRWARARRLCVRSTGSITWISSGRPRRVGSGCRRS